MRKRLLAFVFSLVLLAFTAEPLNAQAQEVIRKEDLSQYIYSEFQKMHIPGMSAAIVSADEVLYSESYGDCAGADSPFILGSISKSFTAVAIMQLVEQGLIDLSRPLREYLPDEKSGSTTVLQLLSHTSGIATYSTLEDYTSSDTPAAYQYSNVNFGLLGKIIERVSGMKYGSYIQKNIFEPLHMDNSYTSLDSAKAAGMTDGYRNYFGRMVKEEMSYPEGEIEGWLSLPSAFLISTAADMGKYLQFYLRQGEGLLSPESIKRMTTGQVDVIEGYQYGMGWGLDDRTGELLLTHGGNVENYTAYMQLLPERGLAVIVLTNACDYFVANDMVIDLAYNISYKLMGEKTTDIGSSEYLLAHTLIDAVLMVVLFISLLPLLTMKRWYRKNREGMKAPGILRLLLIHAALPTLLLNIVSLLGTPMSVVRGFAPDIFLVQIAGSALLYLVGVYKVIYCIRRCRKTTPC